MLLTSLLTYTYFAFQETYLLTYLLTLLTLLTYLVSQTKCGEYENNYNAYECSWTIIENTCKRTANPIYTTY